MLTLKDVFVVFDTGTPLEKVALRGINCRINPKEIVALVGNPGAGKSTLLKFLAGYIQPSFGRVSLDNRDITFDSLNDRSKQFTFVSYKHDGGIAENLTIAENLALASLHHQKRSLFTSAINSEIHDMYYDQLKQLNFLGMESLLDELTSDVAPIYRHVLSLLVAVMKDTDVILIDEHITGLNKEEEKALIDATFKIVKTQNITTIVAMSDPGEALALSDRTIVMSNGQIVADLFGENKAHTKVEDLFASFKITPKIKEAKPSTL